MRTISFLYLITISCLTANENLHCHNVSGGVTTNFINAVTTLGVATGDLAGALGVTVLGQSSGPNGSTILHVQHHWVTQTGETLSLDDAKVTLFPTPVTGLYAGSYLEGVVVNENGTGRYKGASGKTFAWGAADLNKGQITLRYEGRVCFAK